MRKPLIISIDPGTTVGYAVLDFQCNCLASGSLRNVGIQDMLPILTEKGKPVIIATDKKVAPQSVLDVATQVGAVVYSPKEDLLREEKRVITKKYAIASDHEMDALAAALTAYQSYAVLFQKVDKFLKHKQQYADEVKSYIVGHPWANIQLALELVEAKNRKQKDAIQRVIDKKPMQQDVDYLAAKITRLLEENALLEEEKTHLIGCLKDLKKQIYAQQKKIAEFNAAALQEHKLKQQHQLVAALTKSLHSEQERSKSHKHNLNSLQQVLFSLKDYVLLKKLPTLGHANMQIDENDILFVDNPNMYSEQMVAQLRNKVTTIVHQKPASAKVKRMLPFLLIPAESLRIIDFGRLAFAGKKEFYAQKAKQDIMNNVLREFQEERKRILA